MRSRVFFKLFGAFLLVILAATITLDIAIRRAWEGSLRAEIERAMRQKTRLFADRVENERGRSPQELALQAARSSEARATIIDSAGTVLADSEADPARMENHATRPEFAAALAGRTGTSVRGSHTVGIDFLYVALPVRGGASTPPGSAAAVRLAYPLAAVRQTTAQVRGTLLKASALALAIAAILAGVASRSISGRLRRIMQFAERVAAGDLSARVAERSSDEIAQVAAALDRTANQLERAFRELEQRRYEMETLLNSMQEPVLAVSNDGKVQWANGAMEALTGGRVHAGMRIVELLRDPDFRAAIDKAIQQKTVARARVRSAVPGRVFDVTSTPMPEGAVAVLHDLTEMERVEKTRRDFIANVSHELRTPLTSIQGYAETLLDGAQGNGGTREFLEIIRKNAERMARLTQDLLILARVESGEQKLELEPVSADELVNEAAESFRELAMARGLQLVTNTRATAEVVADRDAIHQVFSNLLDNALKYAAAGERIEIGSSKQAAVVEFHVRDFGPGIASEHLPRLFERFYRVDKARSREAGGTGLGLAIVKHIVLNHGGTVRAQSDLGRGSTFYFTLPLATAATLAQSGSSSANS